MADKSNATEAHVIKEPSGRAFVPSRAPAPYPQPFRDGQDVRYMPKRFGLAMNVTITKCKKDETTARWFFQAEDSAGVPIKSEDSDEPIWIPQGHLFKDGAAGKLRDQPIKGDSGGDVGGDAGGKSQDQTAKDDVGGDAGGKPQGNLIKGDAGGDTRANPQ